MKKYLTSIFFLKNAGLLDLKNQLFSSLLEFIPQKQPHHLQCRELLIF